MANKRNRSRQKKRRYYKDNFLKTKKNNVTHTATQAESDQVSTDETNGHTVLVAVVSILSSVSEAQDNLPTTDTNVRDLYDPLLLGLKTEKEIPLNADEQHSDDDVISLRKSVESIKRELEIEPIVIESVKSEPSSYSPEFNNMCRLCLAKDEGHWTEIFSKEPYVDSHRITQWNIVQIIEQSTTVKVSKNDHLPKQLCDKCFLSIQFVHQFRQKAINAQRTLDAMTIASSHLLRMEKEQKNSKLATVDDPTSHPAKTLVKVVHLKPIPKPILNKKQNSLTDRTATVASSMKQTDAGKKEKDTSDVQCELCGMVFETKKLLQYHINKHNGVKPFQCTEPFCDKSFYSPTNLKSHIDNVHCTDPKFKCDLCEKAYTKSDKLKIHRTTHFPPTIPCTVCGKLLRSISSVYKHRKSHTERMHHCQDCGKSFRGILLKNSLPKSDAFSSGFFNMCLDRYWSLEAKTTFKKIRLSLSG